MTHRFHPIAVSLALLASLMLSGCGSPAKKPARVPRAATELSARDSSEEMRSFEKQQRERAISLEEQGALAEAASAWEVLVLLRPGEYDGRLAAVQKRIDLLVHDYLARARQELKGNLPLAEQLYLSAVALQPQNKEAADALRAIERARIRQEHLLKPGKTLAGPVDTGKRMQPPPLSAPANPLLMEQASNLASQGDIDEAIDLMTGQLKAVPNDPAARDLLADLHYKKAQAQLPKDRAAALATAKRCLQVQPRHLGCNAVLTSAMKKPPAARPAASSSAS